MLEDVKMDGGLDFRDFRDFKSFSTVLHAKHAWRILTDMSLYWTHVVKAINFRGKKGSCLF